MMPMADRLRQQRFFAFCAYEAIEPAWERAKQLVDSGRPMIYVERWMGEGDLRVSPGLRLIEGGYRPGVDFRKNDEEARFSIVLQPGALQSLGMWAATYQGDEAEAAGRFHAKREGTRIVIEGFGLGREDHIEITTWNEHGVGSQRSIYFGFESVDERAEREGAFLDELARHGDWSAAQLRQLAEKARYEWEPALDLAAGIHGEKEETDV